MKSPLFIAEIKVRSPFGFKSKLSSFKLMEMAVEYGDMVSVHTHEQWGGSYEHLAWVRKYTSKKILAKGIHGDDLDIRRALNCGADYVLVVGRIPPKGLIEHCWVELTDFHQMDWMKGKKAVWNQRDLFSGMVVGHTFAGVRSAYPYHWLCQASGIKTPKDVHPKADAFIVGEHLPKFVKSWRHK